MAGYIKVVALVADKALGAVGGLPQNVTISTFAGLVRDRGDSTRWAWQRRFLVWLANKLDANFPYHCHEARQADIHRNESAAVWLKAVTAPEKQPQDQ